MYPDVGKRVVRRAPNAERGGNSILVVSDRIKTFRFPWNKDHNSSLILTKHKLGWEKGGM
jgi:hypothetical protein